MANRDEQKTFQVNSKHVGVQVVNGRVYLLADDEQFPLSVEEARSIAAALIQASNEAS